MAFKMASKAAKMTPRRPKMAQDGSRGSQDGLKTAHEAPKTAQEGSKRPSWRARGNQNHCFFFSTARVCVSVRACTERAKAELTSTASKTCVRSVAASPPSRGWTPRQHVPGCLAAAASARACGAGCLKRPARMMPQEADPARCTQECEPSGVEAHVRSIAHLCAPSPRDSRCPARLEEQVPQAGPWINM